VDPRLHKARFEAKPGTASEMMPFVLALSLLMMLPAMGADQLDCKIGPITKPYGGTSWLVYACDDKHSLIFVSAPGSRAMPFYFSYIWEKGNYHINGEGTGNKRATDAAFREISALTPTKISGLLAEAQAAAPHR
jgi:hypothetical protein